MKNLKAAAEGADSSLSNIVKCTILLTDINNFNALNEVYGSYFEGGKYPARACFSVVGLPKNVKIEIEAVAVRSAISDHLKKKVKSEW